MPAATPTLPRTWHFTATKIALLSVMTLSTLVSIIAGWFLFAYGTSYDPAAPQATVLFLTMVQIGTLIPNLIATVAISACIALFAWGQTLSLRQAKRDLDHEAILCLIEIVARDKADEVVSGAYDRIAETMRVPRLIESIKNDWPLLNQQVAEWAAVLAFSVARDLTPLRKRTGELVLQCQAAAIIEATASTNLSALQSETQQLADNIARIIVLHRANDNTKQDIEAQILRVQTKLAELGPIAGSNVVVFGQSAS